MKIKHITENRYRFENEFNIELKRIKKKGGVVVDVKYSSNGDDDIESVYSAIIIYCEKLEYRELVIDKILDK